MANITKFLDLLTNVKPKRSGNWLACCSAHLDKTPSLNVRYVDDRILVHCFGGCSVDEIVASMGLTLADLMPERQGNYQHSKIRRIPATDILEFMAFEGLIIAIAGADFIKNGSLTEKDFERMKLAVVRMQDAVLECHS
jgi:hypothetical protein